MYKPDEHSYIDKLTSLVDENLTNDTFGVTDLARDVGLSHSALHRKLKKISQQSVSQFIRETRLKRAMELLQMAAGTVAEIAYGVGFGSATYFSKCFHDYYGYPPGEVTKRGSAKIKSGRHSIRSIAILPIGNCTEDNDQLYLATGIHEALISELGQLGSIKVISKASVMAYPGRESTIKEIAKELEVDAIVMGNIHSIEGQIKIELKLINAFPNEKQLWIQSFDLDMSNILRLYGQMIRRIALEIHLFLSPVQRTKIVESREVNPECYRAYLRGKYHMYELTEKGTKQGLEYLHRANSIDPGEPFAYAGLALGYLDIAHGPLNPGDAYAKAESLAIQAFKLDPNLAETHLALAELSMYSKWDYDEAEVHFRRALEINPYLSIAHFHYAWLLFLLGRKEEAVFEHELAQKYDPFNPVIVGHNGMLFSYLGHFKAAIREVEKSFEIQKTCPDGYFALVETYLAMEKEEDAIKTSQEFVKVDPEWKWVLGYAYAKTNHRKEAEIILDSMLNSEITSWNAFGITVIYSSLGKMDEAFKWMAYEPHHAWVPWLSVLPVSKLLYQDDRFHNFLKHWNLTSI